MGILAYRKFAIQRSRYKLLTINCFYIPGILGMPGIPFMRLIIWAILLPVIICIILRVWSNCLMSLFTSWISVPEPLAIRWRRLTHNYHTGA